MTPTLIVKTGTTLESLRRLGDFEDWICVGMNADRADMTVADVFEGEALPRPTDFAGVAVTGSPAMVSHREARTPRPGCARRSKRPTPPPELPSNC